MNILHLWTNFYPDLFDRSHELCLRHGLNSRILCADYVDYRPEALEHVLYVRRRSAEESNRADLLARVRRAINRRLVGYRYGQLVRRHLEANQYDVMHCHFGSTASDLIAQGQLPSLPCVVSFYGVDASAELEKPAVVKRYQELFDRGALIHVLCEEVAERMVAIGCSREQIVFANLPASIEHFPKVVRSPASHPRFLIPARFVAKKGHIILFDAFRTLREQLPEARLTCYGYGPAEWLHREIRARGLQDVVTVIDNAQSNDFEAEYLQLLAEHDIVLTPSVRSDTGDDEGGPALTTVMAQAAGLPVIVSDFPGAERSVDHGVEGLVVPAGNSNALLQSMLSLAQNEDLISQYGDAGRERALKDFSEQQYWHSIESWYTTLASRN